MKKKIILIAWFILIGSLFGGQNPEKMTNQVNELEKQLKGTPADIPVLIQLGQLCHKIVAMGKNDQYMKKGENYLKKVLEYDPNNALALVWYGSLMTLKGRDSWLPWQKLKHVEDGCKVMDNAVKNSPDNLTVRYIRARNNLSLPLFFHRIDTAIVDLNYIIKNAKSDTNMSGVPSLEYVYMDLALAYQNAGKLDKSIEIWEKVVKEYPDSEISEEAQGYLEKYGN